MKKEILLNREAEVPFRNNTRACVGTGRMGLALQKEYQDQLAQTQALVGFEHIRGHGLFCDDMSIYQRYRDEEGQEHTAYNFTYLDRVMDMYRGLGLKPFLELGFMPKNLASGTQTIFYWKGNTTPPASEEEWCALVKATITHLAERYGYSEVATWPCEVWNEPNLPGFWENADEAKYHQLYRITARAVRETIPEMKIGGPAVCGGEATPGWIRRFLEMCRDENLPCDFLTRHMYMGNTPERRGRYLYHTMRTVDDVCEEMLGTREIIDSFDRFRGMPMHITEFNTSYNPFCPIHDTNYNAACVAGLLAKLGDTADSYSYWTFGDVFEEGGVPSRPFHGGFGMIANQGICKPTLWVFQFFTRLKGKCVYRDEHALVTASEHGTLTGILWNIARDNRETCCLRFTADGEDAWTLITRTTDEECCNPLKVWHDLGEPASLTGDQLALLKEAGQPALRSCCLTAHEGKIDFDIEIKENAVVFFELTKKTEVHEPGYDYEWYSEHR